MKLTIALCILSLVFLRIVNPARAEYYIQWVYNYSTWPYMWIKGQVYKFRALVENPPGLPD